jgi:5,10-methylenetetrahydromethanopterin reductase
LRIGIIQGTGGEKTLAALVDAIVRAEQDGFASCWLAQIFAHDALTVIALAGQRTSRIELGTAVVPTYPRHPHSLAQQAATVNVAIGHRLALGLGRSHQIVIESMFGIAYDKPLTHIREYLTVVRELVTRGKCAFSGKMYRVNAPLEVPDGKPFPILLGALMPKMVELCAELCDGTLTWMTGPTHLSKNVVPVLAAGSRAAGREMPRVVSSLPMCLTDDPQGAREIAAKAFQVYGVLPVYRACLDAEGATGPADIALIGDESTLRAGLARMRDAGASDFYAAIFPDGDGPKSYRRTYDFLKSLRGAF